MELKRKIASVNLFIIKLFFVVGIFGWSFLMSLDNFVIETDETKFHAIVWLGLMIIFKCFVILLSTIALMTLNSAIFTNTFKK
jgi:hypothetical protein